jgi:hypothetical protein
VKSRDLFSTHRNPALDWTFAPRITKVAFLGTRNAWNSYRWSGKVAGIATIFAEVDRFEHFEEAFATVRREQADALYAAGSGAVGYVHRARILAFADEHRLPTVLGFRQRFGKVA